MTHQLIGESSGEHERAGSPGTGAQVCLAAESNTSETALVGPQASEASSLGSHEVTQGSSMGGVVFKAGGAVHDDPWTREEVARKGLVIEPDSWTRVAWIVAIIVPQLYNLLTLPHRAAFTDELWPSPAYAILDIWCDLVYILDIFLHFHLAYRDDLRLVRDRRRIAIRYAHRDLLLHVLASLPLEPLLFYYPLGSAAPLLRMPRLLRAAQLPTTVDEVARILHVTNYSLQKLIKLLALFFFLNLYVACLYFGLFSKSPGGEYAPPQERNSWLPPAEIQVADTSTQFTFAVYFALYLLTGHGPDPDIPHREAQLLFTIVVFFLGTVISAYIIGAIGVLISSLDAAAASFRRSANTMTSFSARKELPANLRLRISRFYSALWARGAAVNVEDMTRELLPPLQSEVCAANPNTHARMD